MSKNSFFRGLECFLDSSINISSLVNRVILRILIEILRRELKWSNIRIIRRYLLGIVISDRWLELCLAYVLLGWLLLNNNALSSIKRLNKLWLCLGLVDRLLLCNNLIRWLDSLSILKVGVLVLGGLLIDTLLLELRRLDWLIAGLLGLVLERLLLLRIGEFLRNFLVLDNLFRNFGRKSCCIQISWLLNVLRLLRLNYYRLGYLALLGR